MSTIIPFPTPEHGDLPRPVDASRTAHDVPAARSRAVWTVKETAHLLSLSLGSTYALVRSGEIPAIKLGGRWLVPKRRLEQWLDSLPDAIPTTSSAN